MRPRATPLHSDLIKPRRDVGPLLHHWCVDQRCHWPPSQHPPPSPPFSQSAHSHSSHKSLKRAPNFNAWHLHQYWCGRMVFQSRLSHTTLILIVLCTSLDIWCRSKIVMALSRVGGVKGQYCCWAWTTLFSSEQESSCPLHGLWQPRRTYLEWGSSGRWASEKGFKCIYDFNSETCLHFPSAFQ